jgi:hypothetical protein
MSAPRIGRATVKATGRAHCTPLVGHVSLQAPQTRDGSFSPDIFQRYQHSEQAFVLALMEMVVQGVSTRKVAAITEELCGVRFLVSDSQGGIRGLASGLPETAIDNSFSDLFCMKWLPSG